MNLRSALFALLLAQFVSPAAWAEGTTAAAALNGFQIQRHRVPREEIRAGGPPRDGIRSVDEPSYVSPGEASWVDASTPVIGVVVGGVARAIPVHVIEYHQIVNDTLAGVPVVITYDPLTGTPGAFERRLEGREFHFGVSGLVFNSSFLMYDRETESLWSHFLGSAISGANSGKRLRRLRVRQEPMAAWFAREPKTRVLARPLPKNIDYRHSPFSAYWVSDKVPFPVRAQDPRYHPKELTLGVEVGGHTRAYLGSLLTAAGGRIVDEIAGHALHIAYDGETGTFGWEADSDVTVTDAYWFAWKAFHPETEIWNDLQPH